MPGVTYFLIIAVENYNKNESFKRVRYAENDANDIIASYLRLGYELQEFDILINHHATKTAIEQAIKKITIKTLPEDRVIIYFAGHGFSLNGKNLIAPADAMIEALEATCISIDTILGWLKKSKSKKNILFLDCCHSGFEPGENIRDAISDFSSDDLVYNLKDEVYCVGFASCQTHQTSNSNDNVKHGVWSHFLITALAGNADGIYENGILISDKLQAFLRQETYAFVKINTNDRREQIPVQFGYFTDRFVIEDLNLLFEQREAERAASAYNLTSITIFDTQTGLIKHLPAFQKYHRVPDNYGEVFDNFVKTVSGSLLPSEIERKSEEVKDSLNYTRKEISVSSYLGYCKIETPDFVYETEISQSDEDQREYVIKRSLYTINDEIILNAKFNNLFSHSFSQISFEFDKTIDINTFIDRAEIQMKSGKFKLKYSPADTSKCTIIFIDSVSEIIVTPDSINITVPQATSPSNLIEVYKATAMLLETSKISLLH